MYEKQEPGRKPFMQPDSPVPPMPAFPPILPRNIHHRASTIAEHYLAVERVIQAVLKDLSYPFTLQDMADIAAVSPYHFNRIFRFLTGTPPLRFLSALRIAEAKKLLLNSPLSITTVCFEVGYNSLGTFSARFKELVGVSPTDLRYLVKSTTMPYPETLPHHPAGKSRLPWKRPILTGEVKASEILAGPILIGLFDTPIPQGQPIACTILPSPGAYGMSDVPNGRYYVFAVAPRWSDDPLNYALFHHSPVWVGVGAKPVIIQNHQAQEPVNINLRRKRLIDPPILVDLLSLLVKKGYARALGETSAQHDHDAAASSIQGGAYE